MCGRYFIASDEPGADIAAIVDALNRGKSAGAFKSSGEICPGDTVPVVANSRALNPRPFAMHWGYRGASGGLLFNARSETAAHKPTFRDGMAARRCAVPASWYFEWKQQGSGKIKYAIGEDEPDGMLWLAGIYRLEQSGPAFTILTRNPSPVIALIHNRMPCILPREAVGDWLSTRYDAGEVLQSAVLNIGFRAVQPG